ncbi:heterokaryon incompatibility protein-domain-containing protein [Paraphoma chrysanthemicola]|uniref:Heterokaryon incompatibility protein-domain-containing protein n=1 Tax=Paraphoma chrysanthemicola TaxID=798071 RepID=A0A8K0VZ74_9PLEO|nr:heterokaryon incompatibility protein-domain-containing protein [Paraphoma chrysanthemicola]
MKAFGALCKRVKMDFSAKSSVPTTASSEAAQVPSHREESTRRTDRQPENSTKGGQVSSNTPLAHFPDDDRELQHFDLCDCYADKRSWQRPVDYLPVGRLIEAAAGSCYVCSTVYTGLGVALGQCIDPDFTAKWKRGPHGELRIDYMKENIWGSRRTFEIYLGFGQESLPPPIHKMGNFREIHEDPISSECINRVKEMLDHCEEVHQNCRASSPATLPRRVVDIGTSNADIKLYESNAEAADYVALSHCWGSSQNLTTTKATISEHKLGIAWDIIPKTFQDATRISRELAFRYIWIDSLCIVQDDSEDWKTESAKMDKVYEDARLTIAASSSPADADGFLQLRTKYVSKQFATSHLAFPGGTANFTVRQEPSNHLRHDVPGRIRDSWRANFIGPAGTMQPLDYRAWCFQEKLVSRRLLWYCENEIEWDCLDCSDCECGSRYRVFIIDGSDWRNGSARQGFQGLNVIAKNSPLERRLDLRDAILKNWRMSIIPTYTQLSLTQEMDRLPALSAVAKTLEAIIGDEYLSGHWRSDLLGLAWVSGPYGKNPPNPGRLPAMKRAPSWSWASIEGPVDFCYDNEDDYAPIYEIIEEHSVSGGASRSFDVDLGPLKVAGHMIPGRLSISDHTEDPRQEKLIYRCFLDDNDIAVTSSFYPDAPLASDGHSFHRTTTPDRQETSSPVNFLAILIAHVRRNTGFTDRSEGPVIDFSAVRWLTLMVLSSGDRTAKIPTCKRLGLLKSVHVNQLPAKWDERWPKQEMNIV